MPKNDIVPAAYQEESKKLVEAWDPFVKSYATVKSSLAKMVQILESSGYNRTKAIEKIVTDHKHLKGFSRASIYRELPDNMRRGYSSDYNMLPMDSDVSNETFPENSVKLHTAKELAKMSPVELAKCYADVKIEIIRLQQLRKDREREIQETKDRILSNEYKLLVEGGPIPSLLKSVRKYKSEKDNHQMEDFEGEMKLPEDTKPCILKLTVDLTTNTFTKSSITDG